MIKPKLTNIGLLESYNESLIWWAIIKKANIKVILNLKQYKSALVLLLAFKGKSVSWD